MGNLMDELAHRYSDRIVIFDAPPVLMLAETSVLAMHVGQIVFVISSEKTARGTAKEALDLIADSTNINLLLNRARKSPGTAQFGEYYPQYHGKNEK
jgi:Mrp family chromosome partitioning ATPase